MSKPLAKSLHTVTVLVRVASLMRAQGVAFSPADAVAAACDVLGLSDAPDAYGLREAAVRQLVKHGFASDASSAAA